MTSAARTRMTVAAISIGLLSAGASMSQGNSAVTLVAADHAGAVQIGMTVKQAERATRQRFVTLSGQPVPAASAGCSYVRAVDGPRGLTFMLNATTIVRVDVDAPNTTTATTRSIRRGDSETAVMRAYPGRIVLTPAKYLPQGHNLVYTPASAALAGRRIVFQTDGHHVLAIHAGRTPEINLVERCG